MLLTYSRENAYTSSPVVITEPQDQTHSLLEYKHFLTENAETFAVENQISSLATKVFFVYDKPGRPSICFKVWQPCNNPLYQTQGLAKCNQYTLNGLKFNRPYAKDVYLGIASVEVSDDEKLIKCGKLIIEPDLAHLEKGKTYALVMRRLEQAWRLDHQLVKTGANIEKIIGFLALQVANMHQNLVDSPPKMGKYKHIASKLRRNSSLFNAALKLLNNDPIARMQTNLEEKKKISSIIDKACKDSLFITYFKQRHEQHHIKRCHGDLKTTNLWICPPLCTEHKSYEQIFVALDCIDFKPVFCHIDTLSDIAMLVVDLEANLAQVLNDDSSNQKAEQLIKIFLDIYLEESHESREKVDCLLEYYMTEKAMVLAYMCILFDKCTDTELSNKYLEIALHHALKLEQYLQGASLSPVTRFITKFQGIFHGFINYRPDFSILSYVSPRLPRKM
jgi:aminoglycoside phosphotransferase family enzyme